MIIMALVSLWLICSFLSYGVWVAYFQKQWPETAYENRIKDRVFGAIVSLIGGPIALIIIPCTTGFRQGWML